MRSAPRLDEIIFGTLGTRSVAQSPPRCPDACRVIARNTLPPVLRQPSYPLWPAGRISYAAGNSSTGGDGRIERPARAGRAGNPSLGLGRFRARQHGSSINPNKIIVYIIYLLYFLHFDYPTRRRIAKPRADRLLLKIQTLEVDKPACFPEHARMPTTCEIVRNGSPWAGILRPLLVLLRRCRCGPMTG